MRYSVCVSALAYNQILLKMPPKRTIPELVSENSPNLQDIKSKLSKEGKLLVTYMEETILKLKMDLECSIQSKNMEITELKSEVTTLQGEVKKLKCLVDDADAYERKDTIIVSGDALPAATTGEVSSEIIRAVVGNELKFNLPADGISTAHRLGKKPTNQTVDKRNIIVKLVRRDLKHELIKASRHQPKPARLFISESLTPSRQTLLFALRRMKKSGLIQGCHSYEGRVYAFTAAHTASGRDFRHLIASYEDLREFCNRHVKQPLDNFLDSWNH